MMQKIAVQITENKWIDIIDVRRTSVLRPTLDGIILIMPLYLTFYQRHVDTDQTHRIHRLIWSKLAEYVKWNP